MRQRANRAVPLVVRPSIRLVKYAVKAVHHPDIFGTDGDRGTCGRGDLDPFLPGRRVMRRSTGIEIALLVPNVNGVPAVDVVRSREPRERLRARKPSRDRTVRTD